MPIRLLVLVLALLCCSVAGSVAEPRGEPAAQPAATVEKPAKPAKSAKQGKCGKKIRKPGGKLWRCTLSTGFNKGRLPKRWQVMSTPEDGYRSGTDCYLDDPATVRVRKGKLLLSTGLAPEPFSCRFGESTTTTQVRSGSIATIGRFAQAYGRFAFRVQFPRPTSVQGLQSAIWLYPADPARFGPFPASGEIDIAEAFSRYPNWLYSFVHYLGEKQDPHAANFTCGFNFKKKWHTIVLVWSPTRIVTKFDGRTCLNDAWLSTSKTTAPEPFNQPFSIVLTQGIGIKDNVYLPGQTPLPATMKIDWVRVWK